jgi:hypothetical protein
MKNRYVGDIGDLFKYALLRRLASVYGQLGVVWYLNPDNEKNGDGNKLHHLRKPEAYRGLDNHVFDRLTTLVAGGERSVQSVAKAGVLPEPTIFVDEELDYAHLASPSLRQNHRQAWFRRALAATKSCQWIFLDPDNGLEIPSCAATQTKGPKYAYYEEVAAFLKRGQSVLIYQHLPRQTLDKVFSQRWQEIRQRTGATLREFYHYPEHGVVFFMLTPPTRA